MKKLVLTLLALGLGINAEAQQANTIEKYNAAKIRSHRRVVSQLTPEFIYTGSVLDGADTQDLDGQRMGVGAGARLDIGRGDFVFETGILYRQMGGVSYLYSADEAAEKGLSTRLPAEIELNYISIPLMAKYYFNGRDNSSFFARGGLQPSLLIYREARLQDTTAGALIDMSNINDFDLIMALGMGFQIELNETTLITFEGTYLRGMTSVFNNMPLYTNGFQGSVGLGILL
jgi:hypothetical protein